MDFREKLRDQVLKYKTKLSKLRERTEAELQQKDLQLASTEAKLCQVLLQLAKTKRNEELITFDHSEEKVICSFVHLNIFWDSSVNENVCANNNVDVDETKYRK